MMKKILLLLMLLVYGLGVSYAQYKTVDIPKAIDLKLAYIVIEAENSYVLTDLTNKAIAAGYSLVGGPTIITYTISNATYVKYIQAVKL